MKTFHVYGKVSATKYLGTVQAETEAEAKEKGLALETVAVSICYHCSSECEDPEIHDVDVDEAP